MLLNNCEMLGNKGDGLKVRLAKCFLFNNKIRQNVTGALQMSNSKSESLIKIYCHGSRTNDIKGKIYGDTGLLYPKILIIDDIDASVDLVRKKAFQ